MTDAVAEARAPGGAQVAAEAMPYHSHRRPECNTGRPRPCQRVASVSSLAADEGIAGPGVDLGRARSRAGRRPCEVGPVGVEYLVRAARVTDIDRLVALSDAIGWSSRAPSPLGAADLLRQLVYLPQASVFVAESAAHVVGGAVLALRPSVVPAATSAPSTSWSSTRRTTPIAITEALLEELLRSASNKGCTVVEAAQPDDPADPTRWERLGFVAAGPRLQRIVTAAGAAARRIPHERPAPSSAIAPAGRTTRPVKEYSVSKNVAVFVDVANIFYAAKAAGVDIDYVTLLKSATAGRDLVRAYAYTGLDPDNENQRNFHDFLRRSNYKVVSKDIRKYGDGKVKANLDIELVVDMMKTARNLDIAIVVSGDGDFAPGHPGRPGAGRPRRGHQLPRQHQLGPDRGRRPVHRHRPAGARREGLALRPTRRRGRGGPVDDRGPRQADRGDGRRAWSRSRPRSRRATRSRPPLVADEARAGRAPSAPAGGPGSVIRGRPRGPARRAALARAAG